MVAPVTWPELLAMADAAQLVTTSPPRDWTKFAMRFHNLRLPPAPDLGQLRRNAAPTTRFS